VNIPEKFYSELATRMADAFTADDLKSLAMVYLDGNDVERFSREMCERALTKTLENALEVL